MTVLRTLLGAGIGAVLIGTLGGFATVDGIRPPRTDVAPIYPRSGIDVIDDAAASPCSGCTAYDAGYRWAAQHDVRETDGCGQDDEWSYRRGCLDYVQGIDAT